MCGRLGRCCRSLKLLVLSLVLVGLNICDFGVGAVSIAWAIDHRHRNVYFVAAYGSCLVVAVALSSLALADARFPRSIVFAAYVAVLCTAFELYVIVQLDVDADAFAAATGTGRAVAARVDAAPTWLFVAVALRSLVRLALSLSVRATRGRAAPEFSQLPMSNLDDAETRRQELSTSLLARERRDDMRSHFDHKYFGGRTAAGAPAPALRSDAQLPAFLVRNHTFGVDDEERQAGASLGRCDD